jgi:hypothetical protein
VLSPVGLLISVGCWLSPALHGVGRPGDLSAGADGSSLLISPVAHWGAVRVVPPVL